MKERRYDGVGALGWGGAQSQCLTAVAAPEIDR